MKEIFKKMSLLMLWIFLMALGLNSCESLEKKKENLYYSQVCTNVDSIWQFFAEKNDPIHYVQSLCNAQSTFDRMGLQDSSAKLISLMEGLAQSTEDKRYLSYHYLNRAFHYLSYGDLDSARYYYTIQRRYAGSAEDYNKLMSHNFAGCFYYNLGEVDSARSEFLNGYNLAKEMGDTLQLYSFALNTGTAYHDLSMFRVAAYYFSEAYSIGLRRKNVSLMLINNLVASLITEQKLDRALELCESNKERYQKNPNDAASILLKLNHCHILTTKGLFSRCDDIINYMEPASIPKIHLSYYYSIVMNQKLKSGADRDYLQFVDTLDDFIYQNQPESVIEMAGELSEASDRGLFSLNIDSLVDFYNDVVVKKWNPSYQSKYASLIADVYKDQGKATLANFWETRKNANLAKLVSEKDSLWQADIDEQLDQTMLKNAISEKKLELERKNGRNKLLTSLLILFVIIICSLVFLFFLFVKNKKKRLSIIELENKLVSQELQMLRQEKELKENVVTLSQSVLQQVSQLSFRLRHASFAKEPDAIAIRQDMDRLNQLSETLVEPKLSVEVYQSYDYIFENHIELQSLNVTEKRILILTILGNRPKEIGALLNLNDQYIRNVKSKIKKLLPEDQSSSDWSWLKQK
jgi:flagellar basal body-associated protein FliL